MQVGLRVQQSATRLRPCVWRSRQNARVLWRGEWCCAEGMASACVNERRERART